MKRYCKNVDVTSVPFIERAVLACLKERKKRMRFDTQRMFSYMLGITVPEAKICLLARNTRYMEGVRLIAEQISREIQGRRISLPPTSYKRNQVDAGSGKVRDIARHHIKQHILDHLAVQAMEPDLLRRIGEYQCASIPGRGQLYGAKAISRWLRNRKMRYFVKMDVRKHYQSVSIPAVLAFYRRLVKNDDLLYVLESVFANHDERLCIGSYLSQYTSNLLLSELYHFASERLYRVRKSKRTGEQRVRLVQHVLFFADDMLLLGSRRKDVESAALELVRRAAELGMTIKAGWCVANLNERRHGRCGFVDMMGFRCHRGFMTLRRRNWRKARRCILRAGMQLARRGRVVLETARAFSSRLGALVHTVHKHLVSRYGLTALRLAVSSRISIAAC